jgi:Uncharacterized ACR, COG1678
VTDSPALILLAFRGKENDRMRSGPVFSRVTMRFDRTRRSANAIVMLILLVSAFSSFSVLNAFVPMTFQSHCDVSTVLNEAHCTQSLSCYPLRRRGRVSPFACRPKSSSDGTEEEDDEVLLQDEDWRAFRAKLVMGEQQPKMLDESTTSPSSNFGSDTLSNADSNTAADNNKVTVDDGDLDGIGSLFRDDFAKETSKASSTSSDKGIAEMTPLDPSQWAYDSGDVIEQGAVILGGVEQEFGFGLRQQYFHKAAILVLDHSDTFTKGIILNRPTDLTLEDDVNPGVKWRVWFGGDVEGLHASHPDIVCLHSLKNEKATKASVPIMKDIQWTSFKNAKVRTQCGRRRSDKKIFSPAKHGVYVMHLLPSRNWSSLVSHKCPTFGCLSDMLAGVQDNWHGSLPKTVGTWLPRIRAHC